MTVLHPLHGNNDPFSFAKTLRDLQPRYVVLYDSDMNFVRQLEVRCYEGGGDRGEVCTDYKL